MNDITFEEFWKAYDYKKGKPYALAAWNRLSRKDRKAAFERIPAYIEDCQICRREQKYPQGYLNGRMWEDETKKEREARLAAAVTNNPQSSILNPQLTEGPAERDREAEERSRRREEWQRHSVSREEAMKDPEYLRALSES